MALVALGWQSGLLSHWYCRPDQPSQVHADSVLFPLSTYLTGLLTSLARKLSDLGAWCSMPPWWYTLEMRKLRLRHDIKGLYLYDRLTDEQLILYRPGCISLASQYTRTASIVARMEVWTL